MSVETITVLRCNAKACTASVEVEGDENAAWKAADAKGWGYDTDGNDWCPWHTDPERRIQEPEQEQPA